MTVIVSSGTDTAGGGQPSVCRVHVLLIDNQQLFREGLRALLARQDEFVVVGDAAEGNEALALVAARQPDVVVTDLHFGADSSVRYVEELRARFPKVAILVLTALRAHDVAARVKSAGALGYLLKDYGLSELMAALRVVASGRWYRRDAGAVARMLPASTDATLTARAVDLTDRQRQVLRWMAVGYSTREIAQMLGVSTKAVYRQRERIREALQLDSIAALMRFAAREGFAEDDGKIR